MKSVSFKSNSAASIEFSKLTAFLPDAAGNEYDLSDLSKEGEPWVAIDTSKEAKKRTFFLNVCKPLPYVTGCPGKPSGKCLTCVV